MPRQFERISVSLEVTLESSSGKRNARMSDLSMEGCFIDTIITAAEGERINFDLKLPIGKPVQLSGEVTYTLPRIGFGIRFDDFPEEKKQLLKQIILVYGGNPDSKTN